MTGSQPAAARLWIVIVNYRTAGLAIGLPALCWLRSGRNTLDFHAAAAGQRFGDGSIRAMLPEEIERHGEMRQCGMGVWSSLATERGWRSLRAWRQRRQFQAHFSKGTTVPIT